MYKGYSYSQNIKKISIYESTQSIDQPSIGKEFNKEQFSLYIPKMSLYIDINSDNKKNIWIDRIFANNNKETIIIAGHRLPSEIAKTNSFYNLDQLEISDIINLVDNKNKSYLKYEVYSISIVNPQDALKSIQGKYSEELILYTCTPHITYDKRLVVKSRLIKRGAISNPSI